MMIITSMPTATPAYRLELPEIGRERWLPTRKLLESEYIATSTAQAGVLRQIIAYDISSVKKTLSIPAMDSARATVLAAMLASTQTTWIIDTGTARYEFALTAEMKALPANFDAVTIEISVTDEA